MQRKYGSKAHALEDSCLGPVSFTTMEARNTLASGNPRSLELTAAQLTNRTMLAAFA